MKNKILLCKKILLYSSFGLIAQLIFCSLLFAAEATIAQKVVSVKEIKINLKFKANSIISVMEEIENETDYTFVYTKRQLDDNIIINGVYENISLYEVLMDISHQSNLAFQQFNNNITVKNIKKTHVKQLAPNVEILQVTTVTGKVTDENSEGLAGVNVIVKGTGQGTVTDVEGNYSLEVPGVESVLVFSSIGYIKEEVTVGTQSIINVSLVPDVASLEEIVVVGYGTTKKASSTVAVSAVDADEFSEIPTSNLSNVLAGRLSGTQFTAASGVPGMSSDLVVRGTASWNAGSVVYVIDGVVRDKVSFDALDPNEVENISVLKDAAAAAIYGARATNGVILVTTKMGKTGKLSVNFNTVHGISRIAEFPAYMGMQEAIDLQQDVFNSIGDDEEAWLLENNPDGRNLFNAVYEDPATSRYALNITGGSEALTYLLSGSYYKESGFVSSLGFDKYNIRGKINANLTDNLSVGLNLSLNNGVRDSYNATFDNVNTRFLSLGSLLTWNPFVPAYIDGKPVHSGWVANLPELLTNSGYSENTNQQIDALLNIEYKVPMVEGLVLKSFFSRNINNNYTKSFAKQHTVYTFRRTGTNGLIFTDEVTGSLQSSDPAREYISNASSRTNSYQLNAQISYDRTFGDHHISADAVYEQYDFSAASFSAFRYNFPLFPKDQFFAASGDSEDWSTGGSEAEDARLSYIFRASYDYAGKYFITASLRRDGSIKFAPDQRFGNFPSVSAAWLISNEGFYNNSKLAETIDFLKLRFSYGSTGNDAIGGWAWIEQYNVGGNYFIGTDGTLAPRVSYGGIPNPNLTWEKSDAYNIGLDMEMFRGRVNFTVEAWHRHTFDILGSRILAIPAGFGGPLPAENYGVVNSKGLEIDLGYNGSIGKNFKFQVKGNFTYNTTEVELRDVAANTQEIDDPNGKTLSRYIGYEFEKILRTQADIDALPEGFIHFGAPPALGSAKFADLSGPEGIPDGRVDVYDRVELSDHFGVNAAPIAFGLTLNMNYKGFFLESLFAGMAGYEKSFSSGWVDGRNIAPGMLRISPYYRDYWSADNPDGSMPALHNWGAPQSYSYVQSSSLNVWSVGFVRLRNLSIGYDIPSTLANKIGLRRARIFALGTNLLTLTGYEMGDPELNNEAAYPLMSTYSLGLTVGL